MLDLLEKNIMTSSKWQLLPYFITFFIDLLKNLEKIIQCLKILVSFFFFQKYKILAVSSAVLKA